MMASGQLTRLWNWSVPLNFSAHMNCYVDLDATMNPEEQRHAITRIRQSLEGTRPKIMLIEDETDDALLVSRVFRYFGLEATWVKDAGAAINLLKTEKFRVVFLDLKLSSSSTDWRDFLSFYKSSNLDGQVIVLTGAFAADDRECKDALKMGASAIMLKPLTVEKAGLIFSIP